MSKNAKSNPLTIVLVHGAFADASGWYDVTRELLDRGYRVVAVQNSLFGYDIDAQTTKRVIAAQPGPVVLVGHSYGGAVITAAGSDNPKVEALVYVAAFAPDANESLNTLLQRFPDVGLKPALVPDSAGFLYVDPEKYPIVFGNGLPVKQAEAFAVAQKPIAGKIFDDPLTTSPAWKTIPSWYVVGTEDRSINPDLQRWLAHRMNAKITELQGAHLVFISRPREVADVIEHAAELIETAANSPKSAAMA